MSIGDLFNQNFYDLLEVAPEAEEKVIRQALHRARRVWTDETGPSYMLLSDSERHELIARLDQAEQTLLDPIQRAEYNRRHFPEKAARAEEAAEAAEASPSRAAEQRTEAPLENPLVPPPAAPKQPTVGVQPPATSGMGGVGVESVLSSDNEDISRKHPDPKDFFGTREDCTGENLRRYREACGVSLAEIAQRSRISRSHLESIESGDYGLLPAPVYVRGFLKQYCAHLGIDENLVIPGFMELLKLYQKMEPIP